VDFFDVLDCARFVETIREGKILRVSVMAMYLVSALDGCRGHLFDGATAVRFHGVHVHIALNVFFRDQFGKLVSSSGFNLSAVFA